jgi:hypothetical protein
MASTSKHLKEEIALNILNESDKYGIDDSDNCEDDITVADAAFDEDSQVEKEGQDHSFGDSGFI